MTDTFRALCAELLQGLDENRHEEVRYPGHLRIIMARARARLAQPEPAGEVSEPELISLALNRGPWATWLQPGGSLESAHCELSDLLRTAIALDRTRRAPAPPAEGEAPAAWLYKGEPDFDGANWRENWCVTTNQQVAQFHAQPDSPVPLFRRHHTPVPVPVGAALDVVFDSAPGPDGPRFIEVETDDGRSVRAGEWIKRPDGNWALRFAAASQPVAVSERLPEPNTKVLAYYFNDLGNGRTICAIWVPAKSRSDEGDLDCDDFLEYDEEDDQYYWPEGWYEQIENWEDFGWVKVYEGAVVYWQPLPKWPAHALPLPAWVVQP